MPLHANGLRLVMLGGKQGHALAFAPDGLMEPICRVSSSINFHVIVQLVFK